MRDLGRDTVELAKLEASLAVASAVSIAIFSVIALVLGVTAWILVISALVAFIADNWLSLPAALLIVALAMLAGAVPCVLAVRGRTGDLTFQATRRQLRGTAMANKSIGDMHSEIAVVEARVRAERRRLREIVSATKSALQRNVSSRKGMTGVFWVALVAGLVGGFKVRSRRRVR